MTAPDLAAVARLLGWTVHAVENAERWFLAGAVLEKLAELSLWPDVRAVQGDANRPDWEADLQDADDFEPIYADTAPEAIIALGAAVQLQREAAK